VEERVREKIRNASFPRTTRKVDCKGLSY